MINALRQQLEQIYPDGLNLEHHTKNLDKSPYTVNVLRVTSLKNWEISFFVISFQHNNSQETGFYTIVEDLKKLDEFIEKMYFNKKYDLQECVNYCNHLLNR